MIGYDAGMAMGGFDIIGLGTIVVDHLVVLREHPEADTKNAIIADHLQVGGPVPTALVMASRFGRRCAFAGAWGNDAFGQMVDDDMQREGIDVRLSCKTPDTRTGFAHVWVCQTTARRTIAYHRSMIEPDIDSISDTQLAATRMVHLDGWPQAASLALARRAKAAGCMVCLDAGTPKPGVEALIEYVDVLNAPARFAEHLTGFGDMGEAAIRLAAMGPGMVTVTRGSGGAAMMAGKQFIERPAFPVEAVDTTGAGDVFCGAMIHGVLSDWSPDRTLRFAMAAAAIKCRAVGNRSALPDTNAIEVFHSGQAVVHGTGRNDVNGPQC